MWKFVTAIHNSYCILLINLWSHVVSTVHYYGLTTKILQNAKYNHKSCKTHRDAVDYPHLPTQNTTQLHNVWKSLDGKQHVNVGSAYVLSLSLTLSIQKRCILSLFNRELNDYAEIPSIHRWVRYWNEIISMIYASKSCNPPAPQN